ncbi:hypothetical protein OIO90_003039 [Microbotryomycetes sp. JL221]|nr:hypothetical protein OIO90_003039 [Microbotryomycetes sp. JL221]
MRSTLLSTLALTSLAVAAPLAKRNNDGGSGGGSSSGDGSSQDIDPVVLNFALTLEHLEAAFYKQGLAKYSADAFAGAEYPEWVRYRLSEIAAHEATHVTFLTSALEAAGQKAAAACEYAFPDTDPASFIAVAQILEGVGVSAYAGAAKLITSKDYLQAAAQILSVEARHSAWIRGGAQNGDSFPQAFDVALEPNPVFTLASQFITSCPEDNPALPFKAFPALTASALNNGQTTLSYEGGDFNGKFALFLTPLGQQSVAVNGDGSVTVPEGLYGQQYIILASSDATLTDDIVVAGPAVLEVPLLATEYTNF